MKSIHFRPLRRVKKTRKISVATYLSWHNIKSADCNPFELIVDTEYQTLPSGEYVHDHKGELLFFYDYSPYDIPVFTTNCGMSMELIHSMTDVRCFDWGESKSYSGKGIDCGGVPTFSHITADCIGTHKYNPAEFEPLTVRKVVEWYGWFLLGLDNATVRILEK